MGQICGAGRLYLTLLFGQGVLSVVPPLSDWAPIDLRAGNTPLLVLLARGGLFEG